MRDNIIEDPLGDRQCEDDMLVEDLREAFGVGTRGLQWGPGAAGTRAGATQMIGQESTSLSSGSRVGDFEIISELGRGGMGIVYRARQSSLDRLVALKILPGAMSRGAPAVRRFRTEAQAAARLNHANVVPVYAQGEYDGCYYYAMKLIEGVSLDTALKTQPELLSVGSAFASGASESRVGSLRRSSGQTESGRTRDGASGGAETGAIRRTRDDFRHMAALMAGVADGLAHAHDNGVVHRDIKPNNLILAEGRRLYITDFGLAYLTSQPHLTVVGEVMGTPSYLSPEQIRGDIDAIDHRTDIYSLGVTLYELITGRRPFEGETREQILHAICSIEPRWPRELDARIPIDLETICLRAIEKDSARRHPTAGELADDLRRFAEGRPIRSRRVGPIEKAVKWVRRHKAITTAVVTTVAALCVSAGWALSVVAAKHREADRLVQSAYERLVYLDYHKPELVTDDLDRAEALGAAGSTVLLARALAALGAWDETGAVEHLESLLEDEPANVQALYMLAWARWREGDRYRSREVFEQAEDLGGPQASEAWFLRGLAIHRQDPALAIESYQNANAQRAHEHQFFPQAVLHLARAYNQRMYATRTIDALAETESRLRQLIENDHYGGYPYYLLSIAYRLAGEIYRGSSGVRGDLQAEQYFDQALQWARKGQEVDPLDDRPVTAEAECLEQLGLYHDAIAARTQAMELARVDEHRYEGHHYRWRLHYWVGNLDDAMRDIEAHAKYTPESPFYAHVYPALIHAERGHMSEALADARTLREAAPSDAQMLLLSATCLRLLGRADEARSLLLDQRDDLDFAVDLESPRTEEWVRTLFAFCADQDSFESLEQLAEQVETPWKLRGEAHFHAGAKALGEGRRDEALKHFTEAYRSFDGALNYTFHAKVISEKLQANEDWPWWIPSMGRGARENAAGAQGRARTTRSTGEGEESNDATL